MRLPANSKQHCRSGTHQFTDENFTTLLPGRCTPVRQRLSTHRRLLERGQWRATSPRPGRTAPRATSPLHRRGGAARARGVRRAASVAGPPRAGSVDQLSDPITSSHIRRRPRSGRPDLRSVRIHSRSMNRGSVRPASGVTRVR